MEQRRKDEESNEKEERKMYIRRKAGIRKETEKITFRRIEFFFDLLAMIRTMESFERSFAVDNELIVLVSH